MSQMKNHSLTQTEWEQDLCEKMLTLIRNELYLDFRYMDRALNALTFRPDERLRSLATDGVFLYYSRDQLFRLFPKNPVFLNRAYLHSVLHCVFRHPWMRGKREPVIWNLAGDICVEYTIDHFEKSSVRRILSRIRLDYYRHLEEGRIPVTAAAVYEDLLLIADPEKQVLFQQEFYVDDHVFWPREEKPSGGAAAAGENWDRIGRRTLQEMERRGLEESRSSASMKEQIKRGKSRRSYGEFLKKFTILREEIGLDQDNFDLNYYTYGLRLYGNMPLVEPLESREVKKILDFVIVVDTSYSTSGILVRRFLEETFRIISAEDSFFRESHIRVIQCDNKVQADRIIRSREDIDRLFQEFEMIGGGGTDFRPAFAYIDGLLAKGEFQSLKGVLYFTDGKGIYPSRKPPYETAFLFIGENEGNPVPPWAMSMTLMEDWL